jgi:hypothetical protein
MFLKPQKLSSLLVIYPVIIMPLLNIGLTPFFVKDYAGGRFCSKVDVWTEFIP